MLTNTCEDWQSDGRADVLPIHLSAWLVSAVVDRGPSRKRRYRLDVDVDDDQR